MKRSLLDDWFVAEILPHEAALMRYLRRNGTRRNELHDTCQEIYTRIYRRALEHIPEQPKAFAFAIARHIIADRLRRERVVSIDYTQDLEHLNDLVDEATPERRLNARQELRRVSTAFDRLSDKCREVIWLRRIEGLTQREAAARLGMHEKALEGYFSRGMKALADAIFGNRMAEESDVRPQEHAKKATRRAESLTDDDLRRE
jgi:RNA polymerase sigma-70 factor (ECF subfamily)